MTGSPCAKVSGDGSAAVSAEREQGVGKTESRISDRTGKPRTHRRSRTSSSGSSGVAATTTAVETGDRRTEEREERKHKRASDKTKRNERSVPTASAPVPDAKEGTPRSPMSKAADKGEKKSKGRHRRTSESRSSVSPRRRSVSKPSKDGGLDRSSPPSSDFVEAQQVVNAASSSGAPPSPGQGPKQRKRRRSSSAMVTDVEDVDGKEEEEKRSGVTPRATAHSSKANAERTRSRPDASPPSGDDDDGRRSNLVADGGALAHNFPAEAANNVLHCETLLEDGQASEPGEGHHQHPFEVATSNSRSKSDVLGKEGSCKGGGGEEGSASQGTTRLGRKTNGTRRKEETVLKENAHEVGNRYGTEDGASATTHRTNSTREGLPRRKRTVEHPSVSTGLGVKVIDGGNTKQLVLTAGDAVAERGNSGSSSDRSRGANTSPSKPWSGNSRRRMAQYVDTHLHHQEKDHRRRRRHLLLDPEEEERSRAFRDNFAAVVTQKGETAVNPLRSMERSEDIADEATPRADHLQTPPAGSSAATKDQPGPVSRRHLEHQPHVPRTDKIPTCTASSAEGPRMAPSFSIVQETTTISTDTDTANTNTKHQPLSHAPFPSSNPFPDASTSGEKQGGTPYSPVHSASSSSSSSSSVLGRAVHDRTAKYVMRQTSFHEGLLDNCVDLNSPLEEEGGKRGEKNEAGAAITSPSAKETNGDPVVASSSQQPPDLVRGNSRGHDHPNVKEVTDGPAERTRASSNPEAGGRAELLASSSIRSTDVQATCLREEDESASVDLNQQQGLGPVGARPLSRERSAGGSLEEDGELARDLVHFRTDVSRHLVSGERPELFFLRPNESLSVTRIEGAGRLLVTVREEEGVAAVVAVDGAIVYDSAAHFGHAAVQTEHRFPYVAGHRYEFRVVPAQGVELAVRSRGGGQRRANSQGPKGEPPTGLHVVFSVTSSYTKGARLRQEDALGLSLPTFEAPACSSQEPKQPQPSPASTSDTPPTTSVSRGVAESDPHSADVQRPPSAGVAAAIIAPCLSPPKAAPRATIGIAAPSAPKPPAVPKGLAETSSKISAASVGGGHAESFKQERYENASPYGRDSGVEREGPHRPASGIERARRDSLDHNTRINERYFQASPVPHKAAGRSPGRVLSENLAIHPNSTQQRGGGGAGGPVTVKSKTSAWEHQRVTPSSSTPVDALPTLPYIRSHVDYVSPHTEFEQHMPSTGMGSYEPRDAAGAGRFIRSPGYYAHDPPIQKKDHIMSGGGDEPHTRYHPPPPREERYNAPPRYHHPGYFSDGQRSSGLPGRQQRDGHSSEPKAGGHQISRAYNWSTGSGHRWGEPREEREPKRSTSRNNPRSRWKEDHDQGWTGKPKQEPRFAAGHAYRPIAGRGGNTEADSVRQHRSDYGGGRRNDFSCLPDSRRGGLRYGGGFPPSGRGPMKVTRNVDALSDPSRGRTVAREEVMMGIGGRKETTEVRRMEEGSHQAHFRGGYSERLATDGQARRELDSAVHDEPDRRRRTPLNAYNDNRQPRHGTGAVHQTRSTNRAAEERVPPRWIKF